MVRLYMATIPSLGIDDDVKVDESCSFGDRLRVATAAAAPAVAAAEEDCCTLL